MSESTTVHVGETSREQVAYKLTEKVLGAERHQTRSRKLILDTYAECLDAVAGGRRYTQS